MYPKMKVGLYHYLKLGNVYVIHRCTVYNPENDASMSERDWNEPCFRDSESARRRVYELNGWNYKGPLQRK